MRKILPIFMCAVLLLALTGCKSILGKIAYETDVPQGNIIEKERLDKLELDMSKEQVIRIMGSPVIEKLTEDNQAEYIYTLRSKYKPYTYKKVTIKFMGEKYTHYTVESSKQ